MEKYDSYKDSGVEWIGRIPNHWEESQFKFYIKLRHGYQFRDGDFTDEGIKIVKITQLDKGGFLNLSKCSKINKERLNDFEDILIYENDILMCLTGGTIGKIIKVGKVDEPLLQNYRVGHFSPIDKKSMGNNYMFYLMSSEIIVGQIFYDVRETGQPNIGMEDINRMRICIPPILEQQQIESFLDTKTSLIDSLIEKTQRKIELLKEKRTSLINEVVTKGLNPNVEMKDSGVEWIGEIPSGWEIIKGKYILKILTGNYPSEIIEDENGQHFVKVDDLNHLEDGFYLSNPKLKIQDFGMNTLEEGIILFPKRGMTIFTNKVVITKSRCFIDPNLMGIKVFDTFDKIFLFYLLTNRGLGDICDSSTIPQINNKHIYPLEFTNPPLQEQQQIVEYLDEQTQLIDKTISIEEKRIELLKEYRQSLISEVVTGKRKVIE